MQEVRSIPREAERVHGALLQHVPDSLRGVYLHGSDASGGLARYSDVDVLAVVDRSTSHAGCAGLTCELLGISGRPGGNSTRPVELIIFQCSDLDGLSYPARAEFIYGEWLREACQRGEVPSPLSDPELTLLLAQARDEARALSGPPAIDLFPAIPRADVLRATGDALPALLETLQGDERNVLLTLARMWRTVTTGEFVPKDVAAEWVVPSLPAEAAALMTCARGEYLGETTIDWAARRGQVRDVAEILRERVVSML